MQDFRVQLKQLIGEHSDTSNPGRKTERGVVL